MNPDEQARGSVEPGGTPAPGAPGELEALRRECERLRLLHQVAQTIHSSLDATVAFDLIVREAVRVTRASSGSLVVINPISGLLEIQAFHGLPSNAKSLVLRVGQGITGWVARTGKSALVGDVRADRRYIMVRKNVRSELAVPLLASGETRGVLNVDSDRSDAFSDDDLQLLQDLAGQAMRVIENTWLYEQARLKAQLLETLVRVGRAINSTLNLQETLQVVTREACGLMRAKMCSVLMLDASKQFLELHSCHGAGPDYVSKPRLSVDDSVLGSVIKRRKPVQLLNVQVSGGYRSVEVARREGLVSLLSVPLLFGGEPIGTLNVYTSEPYRFSNEEVRILTAMAELSAVALEKARLYERLVDIEEQLRQSEKLSALGLLAAEVAHEIRNPLTVIKMLYHSLDLRFPSDDPRSRDVRVMGEKMEHLNRIVDQILDFSRNAEPRPVPVRLNGLIEELGLLVRHKLVQHGIRWITRLDPALPEVVVDSAQLEQAFLNLILNAVDAMGSGGTLRVATSVIDNEYVAIDFKDTGLGMTEEQCQKAFTSMLKSTKAHGTGLGLAIVGRIIEAHRGKVTLKSKPGRGTGIRILLPLAR